MQSLHHGSEVGHGVADVLDGVLEDVDEDGDGEDVGECEVGEGRGGVLVSKAEHDAEEDSGCYDEEGFVDPLEKQILCVLGVLLGPVERRALGDHGLPAQCLEFSVLLQQLYPCVDTFLQVLFLVVMALLHPRIHYDIDDDHPQQHLEEQHPKLFPLQKYHNQSQH